MTLFPNDLILNGKYRIDAPIGAGAFAQVYRATHVPLQAPRALKILRHDAPGVGSTEFADYAQRFQLEAQLGAKLSNQPHIIQVHDFERDGEMLILVMECASGGSLADRIDQARQSGQPILIDDAIQIALEVADGLAAIHALDVVHRDLKPSNILFDAQGRAKIADLGLAQVPGGPSMRSRLSQGVPHPGTPAYMSPEQINTTEHLSPASDVYALGAVLFEVLTGRMAKNVRPGTHTKVLRADTPEWLDELLVKMLAKDYEARPWDGAEVLSALKVAQTQVNALTLTLAPGVTMDFVRVPAGNFLMGNTEQQAKYGDEKPQHSVYLDDYFIGKYPVTVTQFAAFIKATQYSCRATLDVRAKADHPVRQVSWDDAMAFCAWAAKQTGVKVRLPTEAEWEKAARGIDGRLYPWGNDAPDKQLCRFNQLFGATTPVGKYSPPGDSPYGCADMAGNVWEWCADWFDGNYYAQSPAKNPTGPVKGQTRVVRGGCWISGAASVRASNRYRIIPGYRLDYFGFRCAR
jgi:formylglycine-generating enzyme required for sulfatase activity